MDVRQKSEKMTQSTPLAVGPRKKHAQPAGISNTRSGGAHLILSREDSVKYASQGVGWGQVLPSKRKKASLKTQKDRPLKNGLS